MQEFFKMHGDNPNRLKAMSILKQNKGDFDMMNGEYYSVRNHQVVKKFYSGMIGKYV